MKGCVITMVVKRARKIVRKRVIKTPKKVGGILPLILAGIGALAGVTGGVTNVVKTINDAKLAQAKLNELKRHNLAMETKQGQGLKIAKKKRKRGRGLYLKPYKKGSGYRKIVKQGSKN